MAGDAMAYYTTKSPLLVKRRRWGVTMHIDHRSDTRLLCRVDDNRRNRRVCEAAAAVMVKGQRWDFHIGGAGLTF